MKKVFLLLIFFVSSSHADLCNVIEAKESATVPIDAAVRKIDVVMSADYENNGGLTEVTWNPVPDTMTTDILVDFEASSHDGVLSKQVSVSNSASGDTLTANVELSGASSSITTSDSDSSNWWIWLLVALVLIAIAVVLAAAFFFWKRKQQQLVVGDARRSRTSSSFKKRSSGNNNSARRSRPRSSQFKSSSRAGSSNYSAETQQFQRANVRVGGSFRDAPRSQPPRPLPHSPGTMNTGNTQGYGGTLSNNNGYDRAPPTHAYGAAPYGNNSRGPPPRSPGSFMTLLAIVFVLIAAALAPTHASSSTSTSTTSPGGNATTTTVFAGPCLVTAISITITSSIHEVCVKGACQCSPFYKGATCDEPSGLSFVPTPQPTFNSGCNPDPASFADGEIVTSMEVEVPPDGVNNAFYVRGVVPLEDFADLTLQWKVDGTIVERHVTKWTADNCPKTVEIVALVAAKTSAAVGDVIMIDVIATMEAKPENWVAPALSGLIVTTNLPGGGTLSLDLTDEGQIAKSEIIKAGSLRQVIRIYGRMIDSATQTPTLGVHLYLEQFKDAPYILAAVRISNNHLLPEVDNVGEVLGHVYFSDIHLDAGFVGGTTPLKVVEQYKRYDVKLSGDQKRIWLTRPLSEMTTLSTHYNWFPSGFHFARRFALYVDGTNVKTIAQHASQRLGHMAWAIEGARNWHDTRGFSLINGWIHRLNDQYDSSGVKGRKGYCNKEDGNNGWSDSIKQIQRGFQCAKLPQNKSNPTGYAVCAPSVPYGIGPLQPDVPLSQCGSCFGTIRVNASGPWQYPYDGYGGGTGGEGISPFPGFPLCTGTMQELDRINQAAASRQRGRLYDLNGTVISPFDWPGGVLPFKCGGAVYHVYEFFENTNKKFNTLTNPAICPYENNDFNPGPGQGWKMRSLKSGQPIDGQHFIRAFRHALGLLLLLNDPMAKDDILAMGSTVMTHWSLQQYKDGGVKNGRLQGQYDQHAGSPGSGAGYSFGRAESWCLYVAVATYATQSPEWRDKHRVWFEKMSDAMSGGINRGNGVLYRSGSSAIHQKQCISYAVDGAQMFEEMFGKNAQYSMATQIFERNMDHTRWLASVECLEIWVYKWFFGTQSPGTEQPGTVNGLHPDGVDPYTEAYSIKGAVGVAEASGPPFSAINRWANGSIQNPPYWQQEPCWNPSSTLCGGNCGGGQVFYSTYVLAGLIQALVDKGTYTYDPASNPVLRVALNFKVLAHNQTLAGSIGKRFVEAKGYSSNNLDNEGPFIGLMQHAMSLGFN